MLITCWSSKGGSGTTVVAVALATLSAADAGEALLVDLGGDVPAALGLPEPPVGLTGWDGDADDPTGLRRLEIDGGAGLRLVPRGPGPLGAIGPQLARALGEPAGSGGRAEPPGAGGRGARRRVVVDAGVIGDGGTGSALALELASSATLSLLVLRPCFLALRRAVAAPLRSSGVVLVDEPQRVLGASDIQAALGVPVVAVVPWDPGVARRVDAGLLGSALPRAVARALRRTVDVAPGAARLPWSGAGAAGQRPEAVA